jgi:hypothetical protein
MLTCEKYCHKICLPSRYANSLFQPEWVHLPYINMIVIPPPNSPALPHPRPRSSPQATSLNQHPHRHTTPRSLERFPTCLYSPEYNPGIPSVSPKYHPSITQILREKCTQQTLAAKHVIRKRRHPPTRAATLHRTHRTLHHCRQHNRRPSHCLKLTPC